MSNTPPPAPQPAPLPAKPADTSLRSGAELTEIEADLVGRQRPTRLLILAGPPDSGKTTLIATIYEMMRRPLPGLPRFAWSRTLVAFEIRCHRSRVASGVEEADTDRSPYTDEQRFYHLRVVPQSQPADAVDLLFFDLVGERFNQLRMSADDCRRVTALNRATFLAVLLDGSRISNDASRPLAIEECVNFIQACSDSKTLAPKARVQIVITKFDKLVGVGDPAAIEATLDPIRSRIQQRLAGRLLDLEFVSVAARPNRKSPLSAGYGFEKLFATWTRPTVAVRGPEIPIPEGPHEREAEAFGARQMLPSP